jgi:hypothetical protein
MQTQSPVLKQSFNVSLVSDFSESKDEDDIELEICLLWLDDDLEYFKLVSAEDNDDGSKETKSFAISDIVHVKRIEIVDFSRRL